ncbi:MAG: Crp/Fnr family transcriptional regulator [Kurthia sp.]|nr:Crp/Fnr family transcriptional regulator [Candidatus Kurthia equi]
MISQLPDSLVQYFHDFGTLQKHTKNQSICTEGEPCNSVFLVTEGCVAITKETASGKELTIRLASSGDFIGENILFTSLTSYPISAKTLENSTTLSISQAKLEIFIQQENSLLIAYTKWLQIQTMREQTKLRDLLLHGKKGALFSTLIRLSNTYGIKNENQQLMINQRFTNTELANLCGTSREVVNRLLQELKKEQIISDTHGHIIIHDLQYLKNYCECDSCPIYMCQIN